MSYVEPFYVALGRRVATERERANMTQATLGQRLSVPLSRAAIANIESAKQRALAHTVAEIAAALGVGVEVLVPKVDDWFERELARRVRDGALSEAQLAQLRVALGEKGAPSR